MRQYLNITYDVGVEKLKVNRHVHKESVVHELEENIFKSVHPSSDCR